MFNGWPVSTWSSTIYDISDDVDECASAIGCRVAFSVCLCRILGADLEMVLTDSERWDGGGAAGESSKKVSTWKFM